VAHKIYPAIGCEDTPAAVKAQALIAEFVVEASVRPVLPGLPGSMNAV
jgi:hypothetical protein